MTRLVEKDIESVTKDLRMLDEELKKCCRKGLFELASYASGIDPDRVRHKKMGVVTITSGLGVIGGFSESLAGILTYLGADANVESHTDVDGFYESRQKREGVMMADDDRFISMRFSDGRMSDNGDATGRGFAAALLMMAGNVQGREVLVAGAGPVGKSAAAFLARHGAKILLYDKDPLKLEQVPWQTTDSIEGRRFCLILEATTSADVITRDNVREDVCIAAPGMPLGVEASLAAELIKKHQLVHNPLELGTAVMYTDLLS